MKLVRVCLEIFGFMKKVEVDGLVDYPIDGGDDGDDDDVSSEDDTDSEDEDDEEEEEEHLAPADSAIVASISLPPKAEVERLLAMTTPSPLPPISLSPPSAEERLVRSMAPTAHMHHHHLGRGIDYGFVSTVDAEERRQRTRDVGYGIRDIWVDPAEAVLEITPMTDLYALLEDAQDSRSRISQRVDIDSQRVDLVMGDRMTLHETVWMVEEAYASQEAWAHSIGLSQATHQELQTHRNHVHETHSQMQQAELAALRETDRRRQAQMAELFVLREQQRKARQPGPDARILDHRDASGDADSHI
ncbi:hypothetical protein Tco_1313619 [Tanacetum coccineum]